MAKRILRELRLDKIAIVDKPCQEPATLAITKSDKGDTSMEKEIAELKAQLEKSAADIAALTKSVEERDAALKAAEVAKAEAEALAALDADERAFMAKMSDEKKKGWPMKDKKERKKEMDMEKAADETVIVDGQSIAKSAVGDAAFAIIKAQAAANAANAEAIAKERDARVLAEMTKRAEVEFPHVPGTVQERAAMLKAVDELPEAVRKSVLGVLVAHEALAKQAFNFAGKDGRADPSLLSKRAEYQSKVADIQKRDNCSRAVAMEKMAKEHPDLVKSISGQ